MGNEELPPVEGTPVPFPPGRVAVRLDERYRFPYRQLYDRFRTVIDGLPVLRERDFDGRRVIMTRAGLDALNRGLASLNAQPRPATGTPFERQERAKERLFKRAQYLS
jgi:hypothetical protein